MIYVIIIIILSFPLVFGGEDESTGTFFLCFRDFYSFRWGGFLTFVWAKSSSSGDLETAAAHIEIILSETGGKKPMRLRQAIIPRSGIDHGDVHRSTFSLHRHPHYFNMLPILLDVYYT